jgi:hypothetical protein
LYPSAISGVRSELLVAADLTARGYEVFAPIVGTSFTCDLIVIPPGSSHPLRVEVKTCQSVSPRSNGEGMNYSNRPVPAKAHLHDVLALVLKNDGNQIVYEPPM